MAPAGPESPRSRLYRPVSVGLEAQLGERSGWAKLHDARDWMAMTDGRHSYLSEAQQRHQFVTFFSSIHQLRYRPSGALPLFDVLRAVRFGLENRTCAVTWFRLLHRLRLRCAFRRRIQAYLKQLGRDRDAVLEEWLSFWRAAEVRAARELRKQLQAPRVEVGSPRLLAKLALQRSMVVTPDPLKVDVLWQLYWLLHALFNRRLEAYYTHLVKLVRRRDHLRAHPVLPPALDISAERPQTLRAVTAALFVHALQEPRDPWPRGRAVTFKELLRLAEGTHTLPDWAEGRSTAVVSSAMAGFLTSALCSDPAWLALRYGRPYPLVPPRTWHPALQPVPSPRSESPAPLYLSASDPELTDSPDPPSPSSPPIVTPAVPTWLQQSARASPLHRSPTRLARSLMSATFPKLRSRTLSPPRSPRSTPLLPTPAPGEGALFRPKSLIFPKGRSALPCGQLKPRLPLPGLPQVASEVSLGAIDSPALASPQTLLLPRLPLRRTPHPSDAPP
eukprot:EG_transcript_7195